MFLNFCQNKIACALLRTRWSKRLMNGSPSTQCCVALGWIIYAGCCPTHLHAVSGGPPSLCPFFTWWSSGLHQRCHCLQGHLVGRFICVPLRVLLFYVEVTFVHTLQAERFCVGEIQHKLFANIWVWSQGCILFYGFFWGYNKITHLLLFISFT